MVAANNASDVTASNVNMNLPLSAFLCFTISFPLYAYAILYFNLRKGH